MESAGNMTINGSLLLNSTLHLDVDHQCNSTDVGGTLRIDSHAYISTAEHNSSDIQISGGSVEIHKNASINAGLAELIFEEKCEQHMSLGIGYDYEFGDRMALIHSELNTLSAHSITFRSSEVKSFADKN